MAARKSSREAPETLPLSGPPSCTHATAWSRLSTIDPRGAAPVRSEYLQSSGWRFSFAEDRFMHRWGFGLASTLVCVTLSGCSWRGGDVSGTVKIGGKLATSGTIVIEDARGRSAV